MQGITRTLSM